MAALGALGGSVVAMVSQLLVKRAHVPPAAPVAPVSRGQGLRPFDRLVVTLRHFLSRRLSKVRVKTVEIVKTRREVVAVPIPVDGMPLDKLQKEFRDLRGSLSEQR
jgi:hypothetical protein